MNKVVLVGRLTRDPEVRVFSNGNPVANFTLAINRNFKSHFDTLLVYSFSYHIISRTFFLFLNY